MNRRNLIKIISGLLILYVVVWLGFVRWDPLHIEGNDWLIDKEADPAAAPMPNVTEGDWVAILAKPTFASKSPEERISIANQQFDKIKALAGGQGYDLKGLQMWYQHTATDFKRYPIQKFVFAQGMETYYRDLRQSGFPKPSRWRIWGGSMLLALIGLPFVALLVLLIVGIIVAVFSKNLSLKWRALVVVLLAIVLAEAWLIRDQKKHPVSLGIYHFEDIGNYISVQGTWTSKTKLAAPLQVTQLDCLRQWNHCIEATAKIFNGYLRVDTSYWEIKNWGAEEITFKDHALSLCKVESLRVDRKSKLVTYTNAPKRPKPDSCSGFEDDPIVTHLIDGYKIQYE